MNTHVRKASESDRQAILGVVVAAFGHAQGQEISDLTTDLLADPSALPLLSLVATSNETVVGHILFTKAGLENSQRLVSVSLLAPLSVHPGFQNQGIGGLLIREGLQQLRAEGVELVFVLGHPEYYPKYGFSPAGVSGLEAPYVIAPENAGAWMVQEIQPDILGDIRGKVVCADALDDPEHWRE